MKIGRFSQNGKRIYGILEGDMIYPADGNPFEGLKKASSKSLSIDSVRLLPPVDPPNIICVGRNYMGHIKEGKGSVPEIPLLFLKPTTTVIGPEEPILIHEMDPDRVDYEAELAIIIGKKAKDVREEEALEYALGYACANDVSARGCQREDSQFTRGKGFDTFCPIGPVIATDIDPDKASIQCRLNGKTMQDSNTSDMIFSCKQLISFISQCFTLLPGTLILTGTPEGVGFFRDPPVFLKEGDIVEVEIGGIGTLRNPVEK